MICLMYHRFCPATEYKRIKGTEKVFTVTDQRFFEQLEYLRNMGYYFVKIDQVCKFVSGETKLPEKSVMITIDDGCLSVKEYALPILKKANACATCFVATDAESSIFNLTNSSQRRLTEFEIKEIDGDIINIESHTVTHRPLTSLAQKEVEYELKESRNYLQHLLSRSINYLAIPGNWYNKTILRLAEEAGYKCIWCSKPGQIHKDSNRLMLARLNVEGQMNLEEFAASITPQGIRKRRIAAAVKHIPGNLLGARYWLPLRKLILRCLPGGYVSAKRVLTLVAVFLLLVLLVIVILLY